MLQGINTAAAGMASILDQNNIIANNLANVNTVGFKQLIPTFRNIRDINVEVFNPSDQTGPGLKTVGNISAGSIIDQTHLDLEQGPLKKTDGTLDVAINGDGFFAVQTENGEFYTRNGNFMLNDEGDLVTQSGFKVLSEGGGTININIQGQSAGDIVISADGRIIHSGAEIDKLRIVDFEDKSKLITVGNSLFQNADNMQNAVEMDNPSISQGYLEGSNANMVKSLIDSISGSRTYETLAKVVSNSNGTLKKTVTEVGSLT